MNSKYVFILFLSLALFQGCSLDEDPKTFINPDAFFNGYDSYESAVQGIYVDVPEMMHSQNVMMMREMFADIYGEPDASFEQALLSYQNDTKPIFMSTRALWRSAYAIIKNANFVVSKTSDMHTSLVAEARFLRAFTYFQLVQFYGDIPLRKLPITSYDDIQIPKSTQQEVYDFIIDDLKYAGEHLLDKAPQEGRVYKLAATALLSKVYLTMAGNPLNQTAHYATARDKAIEVINSGNFTLLEDYAAVFHQTTYTKESIWEKLYDPQKGGNAITSITCTAKGFKPILLPAQWFINSFTNGDQRKVWGIQEHFADPSGKILEPFFQKYLDLDIINDDLAPGSVIANYTIPYLRLAEMYLIAAEAENETNGPEQAYQYVNKIRWRARTDKTNPALLPDFQGLSKEQFRDSVYLERKKELHMEGSAWCDLKRTNNLQRIQAVRGHRLVNPIGSYNQAWPIPDTEIINNNIEQNPMP